MSFPKLSALAALAGLAALAAVPAQAAPIQYVFSGPVSGTLNGAGFTDAQITFTASGDTTGISSNGMGFFSNSVGSPAFTWPGSVPAR